MINNAYLLDGKEYMLGGLINGQVDNMIITTVGRADIYEIAFDSGHVISLSDRYSLFIQQIEGVKAVFRSVSNLQVGDKIFLHLLPIATIVKISKRKGEDITIPKRFFILNCCYVTTDKNFEVPQPDMKEQVRKIDSCKFRSSEQIVKEIPLCCGRTMSRKDFYCEKKRILLTQPVCWSCELYEEKDKM